MDIRVILMLAAVGAFALALLYKGGLLKKPAPILIAVMLTALALVLLNPMLAWINLSCCARWFSAMRRSTIRIF